MKRYILAALALVGLANGAMAQDWTGKGNTVADGDYYLYNVKSGKYLTWGTNYGTRASLVQQAGELFTLTASGSGYKITAPGITKDKKGMFLNSSNIPFCDNDAVEFTFTETSAGSKVYTISSNSRYLACRSDYSAEPSPLETVTNASDDGATWMLIKKQDRIDALDTATASNPVEATFYIKGAEINQYFDNAGAWDGTDPKFDGRTGNLEATGYAAENYWGENVESYQTLTGLPAGKYRLSCYGFYRDGSAQEAATKNANGTESIKAYLFAGSNQTPLSSIMAGAHTSNGDGGVEAVSGKWVPNSMAEAVLFFFRGRYPAVTVDAIVGEDGQLKIGIRKDASTKEKWTIWDRFRLTYYGDDLTAYAASLAEAVEAARNFINSHVVPEAAGEAITEVIDANNKEYETKAGYIAATEAINNAVAQYNTVELKSAYAAYYDFKAKVEGLMSGVDDGQTKTNFTDAISTATTSMEGCTTVEGINTQKAALRSAAMTFISSVDDHQFDITFLASQVYSDWKKNDGSAAGIVQDQFLANRPSSIPSFAENFEWTASTTGDVLYQTVSNLPAGYYQVGMYAMALSTSQRDTGITTEATEGDADRSFAFAGDQRTGLPIKFATAINFDDLTTLDVNVHLSNDGDLTFGVHKDANGSNWHFAQIASIVYSNQPDLTNLKATRDALVSEAEGLLASADADFLTDTQKAALQDAIDAGNDADDFDNLNTVTLTTLPNAINAAKQQIQQVKQNRVEMIAALERFENDYNLADGTDYRKVTMSAEAWATLITKVNAVSTALDDVSQASSYSTVKDELVAQMDATDISLRLFKSYKAMVEGTTALGIAGNYGNDSYMDTDATELTAITALNNEFDTYANAQSADFSVADFLGGNLDFNEAHGDMIAGKGNGIDDGNYGIFDIAEWEETYENYAVNYYIQTANNAHSGQLYIRSNWENSKPTLKVQKERMLPVGKYRLSLKWNSNMENMDNLSAYVVDNASTAIGEATTTEETLTYNFEVTDAAKPFDLIIGFNRTSTGDAAAQIIVDDITLTYLKPTLSLADAADNRQTIADHASLTFDVTLQGRTLFKDGYWNTLCLPFNLSSLSGTPLEGATLMELDTEAGSYEHATGLDGGTLYLNFKEAKAITAGTPYIIKWEIGDHLVNPTFTGVTIVNTTAGEVTSTDETVAFIGTFGPVGLPNGDKTNLFMDANNTLCWPNEDNYEVNAFRAYFKLSEKTAEGAREFVLNFSDDTTTGIDGASLNNKEQRIKNQYFDLSGRKLDGRPSRPGIYMRNGQKIIIK